MTYKHIFGPVRSRRLGISLGVDLVPFKTCSLNCIYCECGGTTLLTTERREYVSTDQITSELTDYLASSPRLDYVTFAGSGEPALHSGLGELIAFVKDTFPYKTALLTNGTLFHDSEVRAEVMRCDLVLPSLDAVSEQAFSKLNRADPSLDNERVIEGLVAFSREYRGTIWLEVFIVPGINDSADELARIKAAIERISPARVQINSLDRPGACSWVTEAAPEQLREIAQSFLPLPVEIISRKAAAGHSTQGPGADPETVLSVIRRRPSTIEDIAVIAGVTINDARVLLEKLAREGVLTTGDVGGTTFYRIA